jgi:hypothetical protein
VERFGQTVNDPGLAAQLQIQAKCSQCEDNQPGFVQQLMPKQIATPGRYPIHNQLQSVFRPDASPFLVPHLDRTQDTQIHEGKEALEVARQLDPNSQECKDLLQRIRNIIKDIKKREGELRENPNNLPETTPNDHKNPRESKRGHRRLINDAKANLANNKANYVSKCGQLPEDVRESTNPDVNWIELPDIQWPNPLEWIIPIFGPGNPLRRVI